jgi:phosphoribosylformylglycinamidine cyclo-ligase
MKRSEVIDNARITPGNVIVGLSSSGKAVYESMYNGGMGSNGLTSARHDVFGNYLASLYPETYDSGIDASLVYSGNLRLTEQIEGLGVDAGQLVLSPTRTYAPVIKSLLDKFRSQIHGMVHCSGGGQTKVMHFTNHRVIKDNLFPVPALFRIIQEQSGTSWKEMYQVFNMGHRMELYVPENIASQIIDIASGFDIEGRVIGRVEEGPKQLVIKSALGEFVY